MPVYSGEEDGRTMFVVNPHIFGYAGGKIVPKVLLGPVQLKFKLLPFVVNTKLINNKLMISEIPDSGGDLDWCFGITYMIKLLDFTLRLEVSVYTCQYPLLGQSIGDMDDCLWMWYPISNPLISLQSIFSTLKLLNVNGEIFPWTCSYD